MKAKWMCLFVGAGVLQIILLTGYPPVVAAPPTGEVKTVDSSFGNQNATPRLEIGHANDWLQLLYDPLLGTTPEGKLSPDIGLANKWEMSSDALTWTFYLRKGVKFHDGVEVTAKDVKFSIENLMLPDALTNQAVFYRRDIKNVEVKDLYTLVVHCKRPSIFLDGLFNNMEGTGGLIIPKDYYEKVGQDGFQKNPIGSGPYKWHSQQVGSFIKLEATDKHWRDGVPKYKYMSYHIVPEESTRIAMLKTGEADISRVSRQTVKEAQSAGLNILVKENPAVITLWPNMQWTSPVFSDIRFRKALNLAIDKESIIKNIFGGMARPTTTYPGSIISVVGGDITLKPYPYGPQEARRLIKEGGWEGYEFTLISYDRPGCPEFPLLVEAIAGYWEKVGLKPKIRMSDFFAWRNVWRERKTQNTIHGYESFENPQVDSIMLRFQEKCYFKNVLSSVNIPELNEKWERIGKSKDVNEISKLVAEIYRYVYDHYLAVAVCEINDMLATTKRIPKWNVGYLRRGMNYRDVIKQ